MTQSRRAFGARRGDRPQAQGRRSARATQLTASVGVADCEARGQGRLRHAQARRARRGPARHGGRVPGAAAGAAAVGRRARRWRNAREAGRHDDRRARGARPGAARRAGSARTATTCSGSRAASMIGRSPRKPARPRAWARSIPTTRTPLRAPRCAATLMQLADGVAARLRSHGLKGRTITLKYRDETSEP